MFGVSLIWTKCPDGVEVVEYDDPVRENATLLTAPRQGRYVRFRTERRQSQRFDLVDLDRPRVVEIANARDEAGLIDFMTKNGLLFDDTNPDWNRSVRFQRDLHELVWVAGCGVSDVAAKAVNAALASHRVFGLTPSLDFLDGREKPRLALQAQNLVGYMLLELSMMVENDVRTASCQHCDRIIITGSLTGRRSHAKYCSDRCRVAASRLRNSKESE